MTDVLCSDKTGTLTLNVLQLNEPWLPDDRYSYNDMLTLAALASKRVRPSLFLSVVSVVLVEGHVLVSAAATAITWPCGGGPCLSGPG
jgi:magnesium-transporting ATPase (P-type)